MVHNCQLLAKAPERQLRTRHVAKYQIAVTTLLLLLLGSSKWVSVGVLALLITIYASFWIWCCMHMMFLYVWLQAYNHYGDDMEMICAVLCAGLYPNVIQCKRRGKRTAFYSKDVGKVDIHPSSVNAGVHLFPLPYMIYSDKVKTSSIYIRDSTNISDYALLLFGGSLMPSKSGEGIEMLGGYLHFSAPKSTLHLIQVRKAS